MLNVLFYVFFLGIIGILESKIVLELVLKNSYSFFEIVEHQKKESKNQKNYYSFHSHSNPGQV